MSWNIEKPGDRINGPVTITGNTTLTGTATISGDFTVDTSTLKVDSANNRVGILTDSPSYPLHVVGRISYSGAIGEGADTTLSSSGTVLLHGNSSTWTEQRFYAAGNEQHRIASSGVFTWYDGAGGTRMTLNGTGLGVGVSPATKLHIAGTGNQELKIQTNTSGNPILTLAAAGQDGASILYNRTDNYLSVNISAITGALRLTTSGNLGLGVTPAAWSGFKALQIARGSLTSFGADTFLSHNWYWSGTADTYIANDYATRYYQSQGKHIWDNGGTSAGTAGATISFATKMTLDASGRLSVGPADFAYMSGSMMIARKDQSAITYIGVDNQQNNSAAGAGIDLEAYGGSWYIYNAHSSNFTNPLIFKMGSNERIRFTANGEALFKTNGTASVPTIANADDTNTGLYWPDDSDTIALATGGTERLRIASDGVCTWSNVGGVAGTAMTLNGTGLGVGTSPSYKLDVSGAGNFQQLRVYNPSAANIAIVNTTSALTYTLFSANTAANGFNGFGIFDGTAYRLAINSSGNVGIGTTTPSYRLQVEVPAGAGNIALLGQTGVSNGYWITTDGSLLTHRWANHGGTAMTLNASGSLAIGQVGSSSRVTIQAASTGNDLGISNANLPLYLKTGGGSSASVRNMLVGHLYTGSDTDFSASQIVLISANNVSAQSAAIALTSNNALAFYTAGTNPAADSVVGTERLRIKSTGQVNFVGLASDPAGAAAGDVYYNTTTNKLKCYNGTTWNDLF